MTTATKTLRESFEGTTAEFQLRISRVAIVAGQNSLDVYALWRKYSGQCYASDQSPLLWEFVQWYAKQLGGDLPALARAID